MSASPGSHLIQKLALLVCIALIAMPSYAFRCKSSLIETGDIRLDVEDKCGIPHSRETIGYTLKSIQHPSGVRRERELLIEEWIYKSQQYYDVLTFEGGRLVRIERIRR